MSDYKYISFQSAVPSEWTKLSSNCTPFNMEVPISKSWKESKNRLLVVCEHVTTEDLKSKRLLSGMSGKVFDSCLRQGNVLAKNAGRNTKSFAVAAINFNYFRTYHLDDKDKRKAEIAAAARVWMFIKTYKPTHILISGDYAAEAILINHLETGNKMVKRKRGWVHDIDGIKVVNSVDFAPACSSGFDQDDDDGDGAEGDTKMSPVYCLGFFARNLANLIAGEVLYGFRTKTKGILIDTLPKFKKMMKLLNAADQVAVDTETNALGKISSSMVTIQFALDAKRAFVLPYLHKDSPFTKQELLYIKSEMRKFFFKRVDTDLQNPKYLLFFNAKFDLTIIRRAFDVPIIYWPVYDCRAGEFLLDENLKFLLWYDKKLGYGNLAQTCMVYGDDLYFRGETIDKEDRLYICHMKLSDPLLLAYTAADVQCLFNIRDSQVQRSKDYKYSDGGTVKSYYKDFMRMMLLQMNNNIHVFSQMEERGVYLDKTFIKSLLAHNSPINAKIAELEAKFMELKNVKKANKLLQEKENTQSESLYSGSSGECWTFNINKPAHAATLFFDVLKLAPITVGKSGQPSMGKEFKKAYAEVPEVAMLDDLDKLHKLKSTYVVPFSRALMSPDGKIDGRLRPEFDFFPVVTGRSNSSKPSLQQTPQRGSNAKYVKRMFAAPPGYLILKNDFSAHEVRGWSIVSNDEILGEVFNLGRRLRQKLVKETDKKKISKIINELKIKGDIHRLNYEFFFGVPAHEVTSDQRSSVKAVAFGVIYGKSVKTLSKDIKQALDFTERLVKKFFKRFFKAARWLDWTVEFAAKNKFTKSLIGRRRHLWGYLVPDKGIHGAMNRRAMNAPIQGLGADIGHTMARLFTIAFWDLLKLIKEVDDTNTAVHPACTEVMVHDSSRMEVKYEHLLLAMQVMQWCASRGVADYYNKYFGMNFTSLPEIEFEIGPDESNMFKWNWAMINYPPGPIEKEEIEKGKLDAFALPEVISKALQAQAEIYPDMDVDDAMERIRRPWKSPKLKAYMDKHFPWLPD